MMMKRTTFLKWRNGRSSGLDALGSRRLREDLLFRNDFETRPDVLAGERVVRGTRIPVSHLVELLKRGAGTAELQDDFDLSRDQVAAVRRFARLGGERTTVQARRQRQVRVSLTG